MPAGSCLFLTETLVRNGQFMTSFFPAAGQYFTAIGGLHALAEAMHRFTAAYVRLIGSFFTWHGCTVYLLKN